MVWLCRERMPNKAVNPSAVAARRPRVTLTMTTNCLKDKHE
jgi:hypothetical protein